MPPGSAHPEAYLRAFAYAVPSAYAIPSALKSSLCPSPSGPLHFLQISGYMALSPEAFSGLPNSELPLL